MYYERMSVNIKYKSQDISDIILKHTTQKKIQSKKKLDKNILKIISVKSSVEVII